ncbi:MAG: PKD domain-containing protein [Bacteroidales bacterium]|nr:PKD domain-containing protein [Bacteroidales bacterium]MBN2750532.1 PKD domain-containing protein [Bacteroidales bacterium]
MRKFNQILFSISLLLFLSGSLLAQWTSRTLPNGATLNKVFAYNKSTAFLVGANNAIYKTTNGGATWDAVTVNVPEGNTYNIMDVEFFNANNGFAVTAAGKDADKNSVNALLLVTTDAGLTWNPMDLTVFSDATANDATDPMAGTSLVFNAIHCSTNAIYTGLRWKSADGSVNHSFLFKSTNLGSTWSRIGDDLGSVTINGIVSSVDTLYIGGASGTFKVSRNGGTSWNDYSNATAYTSVNDLRLLASNFVLISTTKGLFSSADYGVTTTQHTTVGSFDALAVDNGDVLFTGGSTANNLRSVNAGASWELANIGLAKTLFDLTLFNDTIYGCSTTGLLFSLHKDQIKDPVADFTADIKGAEVQFLNSSSTCGTAKWHFGNGDDVSILNSPVYRYTAYGTYTVELVASNAVVDKSDAITKDITISEPTVGFTFVVEEGNMVTFTNTSTNCLSYSWDLGGLTTITDESFGYNFPILGTFNVTLTAFNGIVRKTVSKQIVVDTLSTGWSYAYLGGDKNLQKLWVIDNQIAVALGNETALMRTTNGGESWSLSTVAEGVGAHIANDLIFFDSNTGLASFSANGSVNGFLLKSTDAGATWNPIELSLFSDNSGNEATDPVAGQKVNFYALAKTSATTAFAVVRWQDAASAYHGFIYKTTDAGATWTKTSTDIFQDYAYKSVITAMAFDAQGQTGYVAGNKLLLATTNGGESWTNISKDDYAYINEVLVKSATEIFLATGAGVVKTTDAFATFTKVTTDYAFDIIELSTNTYLAGKDAATLKITRDGGENWEPAGEGMASSFFELALFNGKVYGLTNGGKANIVYVDFYNTPVAEFTATADDKVVTFQNTSSNATGYTWDFGDGNTSTEASPVHSYTSYGTYTVKLVATNLCHVIEASKAVTVKSTGINSLPLSGISIWPNPVTNGNLNIELEDGTSTISTITVFDVQGRMVLNQRVESSSTTVNLSLSSGLYLVKVESADNRAALLKVVVR